MQILDDDQQGLGLSLTQKELFQGLVQTVLFGLGFQRGPGLDVWGTRAQFGQQLDDFAAVWAKRTEGLGGLPSPKKAAQHVDQGCVGESDVLLEAAAFQRNETPVADTAPDLGDEAAFADACFAANGHTPTGTILGSAQGAFNLY
jgi:hypothetical protein